MGVSVTSWDPPGEAGSADQGWYEKYLYVTPPRYGAIQCIGILDLIVNSCFQFQHKGIPYCHIPCYTALFGPAMYGHGSPIEAHTSFGGAHGSPKKDSRMRRYVFHMQ